MVAAFPVAKLAYLAVRQLSKPVATFLRNRAKASPFFRTYICMPPAQFFHWYETRLKMTALGLGKPKNVTKLNEEQAVEAGATILGESVIYLVSALTIFGEYKRQSYKEQAKEEHNADRMNNLVKAVEDLKQLTQSQEEQLQQLEQLARGKKK